MAKIDNELVKTIVSRVVSEMESTPGSGPVQGSDLGVFASMNEAIEATIRAQKEWAAASLELKERVIEALRQAMHRHAEEFARLSQAETGMGRVQDKILKQHTAADSTPGLEDLETRSWSGDQGVTLEEWAPYGLVAAVTPSTHPIPVLLNSIIITIAPGNGTVFNVHPAAKKVSARAMKIFNQAIVDAGGPENLVSMVEEPTLDTLQELFQHTSVRLIVATGGPAVVEAAFRSGKKVIAAGPGNPPVIVDDSACPVRAAEEIIKGASFDNNILCIAEKEIFVLDGIWDRFQEALEKAGAVRLNRLQIKSLTERVFPQTREGEYKMSGELVGKNAADLGKAAGILTLSEEVRLLFGETTFDHPFVREEQMMPFLPLVRVADIGEAIERSVEAERGYGHTAMIYSNDLANITRFSRAIDTSIVVVNGSSLAGNGPPAGEGYFSHTISSPTGEGVCTPRDFARVRRITSYKSLRIV